MAAKGETFDVWILQTNSVYRGVPFTVVADWAQQGRLLEDDQVRPTGTAGWLPIADHSTLRAYLPPPAPYKVQGLPEEKAAKDGAAKVEDVAKALEPIQLDIPWKRHGDSAEDDDVDMIPLIDVSLVLLIFFMMTATVTGAGSLIRTPLASYGSEITSDPKMLWIGVDLRADNEPFFSVGQGTQPADEQDRDLAFDGVIGRVDEKLRSEGALDVRIRAHEETPLGVINRLRAALEPHRRGGRIHSLKDEVREEVRP
jgi:biopolymer transport protein ExbD